MNRMIGTLACAKQHMFQLMDNSTWLRKGFPLAVCLCLLLPSGVKAGAFGLGYSGGKTFISYNVSSRLRAFIPLTFKDVIIDYRIMSKSFGNFGGLGLKGYVGLGTMVSMDGKNNKKGKDGDFLGGLGMSLRASLGVETRLSRFPVTIYMEMNPDVDIENVGDIKWKKFHFGFIYKF